MSSTKALVLLALSTLGQVVSAVAPHICTALDSAPEGAVCGKTGSMSNPFGRLFAVERLSLEQCASYCSSRGDCGTFLYSAASEGRCTLYESPVADHGFTEGETGEDSTFDVSCFSCSSNALIDLNFNTMQSVDEWSMEEKRKNTDDTTPQNFALMNQRINGANVLRVIDASDLDLDSERAIITYNPTFDLVGGATYRLSFQISSNLVNGAGFDLLTFFLATNDELIVEYTPTDGVKVGDWTIFTTDVTIHPADGGQGTFLFEAKASGLPLDWYFQWLYLQAL
ncbi:hypothetical protein EDB81DRAFT_932069 [Dactylonectria macrodidyma]|uniref:Apple domain-containing protein n=1 Tax=Dactylonectria macrodidyma TaxID=307937 RepID=A0A9P9F6X1_9HYPO|nr:hypothetical protein EDB81DRAFT_932069 [Dactylonectria macrodidyma]